MADLLPCPWCGQTPPEIVDATKVMGVWRIIHRNCVIPPFSLDAPSREKLIAAWNTRSPTDNRIAPDPAVNAGRQPDDGALFDQADWYWRVADPDDCGDSPEEAINRSMLGDFVVCKIASSFTGATRYGFVAPVLDPESDDTEFVHFATQAEALEAARVRALAARDGEG